MDCLVAKPFHFIHQTTGEHTIVQEQAGSPSYGIGPAWTRMAGSRLGV